MPGTCYLSARQVLPVTNLNDLGTDKENLCAPIVDKKESKIRPKALVTCMRSLSVR
jgi:hypothetical protein